ncbi:MAG: hypothetical protein JF606_27440 [Burkholderiales bacterium]|nr:hypothetical protein [Burkholderiales bacterium]
MAVGRFRVLSRSPDGLARLQARQQQRHGLKLGQMWKLFEHQPVNDSFGDSALFVDFRDERRGLLIDLGDIRALPPRKLLRLSHIFVTHTHMDHFSGFDRWLAVVLARKARVTLYGGPNFIAQVEHKP